MHGEVIWIYLLELKAVRFVLLHAELVQLALPFVCRAKRLDFLPWNDVRLIQTFFLRTCQACHTIQREMFLFFSSNDWWTLHFE